MAATITLLILDVDGVLTDGTLPFDGDGQTTKTFHVRDGAALRAWRDQGGRIALLSARASDAVRRRAAELGIGAVVQGATDKLAAYDELRRQFDVGDEAVCYVGDDWADASVMKRCGLPIAVADAASAIKRIAQVVTRRPGGRGAVADAVECALRRNGTWTAVLRSAGL
ncbi:MAG: HAD-IIIA family hydrolase [Phycisphaerae bacterium]|nr:HAD-IIIA family hydrolase [Phycisphaerae bacterium]